MKLILLCNEEMMAPIKGDIINYKDSIGIRFHSATSPTATTTAELMRITNTGNVGIGTSSPTAKLDVANGEMKISSSSPTFRFDDSNGDGFMMYNNSDILYIMRDDNRNDTWDDGDDDRVVIRGSGSAVNVGIRTSGPADPLDVRGNARFGDQIRIGNGSTSWDWLNFDGDSKELRMHFGDSSNQLRFGRYANGFGAFEANPVRFDMDAGADTLMVAGNSRVGIGTASPAYKLDVVGDAQVQGWLRTTGDRGWFNQTYGGVAYDRFNLDSLLYGGKPVYVASNLRTDSELQVGSSGGRFVVKTNGNVGIGTTNPSASLQIGNQTTDLVKRLELLGTLLA